MLSGKVVSDISFFRKLSGSLSLSRGQWPNLEGSSTREHDPRSPSTWGRLWLWAASRDFGAKGRSTESEEMRSNSKSPLTGNVSPTTVSVWHSSRWMPRNGYKILAAIIVFLTCFFSLFFFNTLPLRFQRFIVKIIHLSTLQIIMGCSVVIKKQFAKIPEYKGCVTFHFHCAVRTQWATNCIHNLFFICLTSFSLEMVPEGSVFLSRHPHSLGVTALLWGHGSSAGDFPNSHCGDQTCSSCSSGSRSRPCLVDGAPLLVPLGPQEVLSSPMLSKYQQSPCEQGVWTTATCIFTEDLS